MEAGSDAGIFKAVSCQIDGEFTQGILVESIAAPQIYAQTLVLYRVKLPPRVRDICLAQVLLITTIKLRFGHLEPSF